MKIKVRGSTYSFLIAPTSQTKQNNERLSILMDVCKMKRSNKRDGNKKKRKKPKKKKKRKTNVIFH